MAAARLAGGEERVAVGAVSDRPLLIGEVAGATIISDLRGSADYRPAHGRRPRAPGPGRCSVDDRVTGRFAYSQDAERPGMLHGRVLRSHHPHARVLAVRVIDELPEGCVVLLPEDVADTSSTAASSRDTPILARGVARFAGDPVAAVAAPTPRAAARRFNCLEADYEPLPDATSLEAALAEGAPLLHEVDDRRGAAGTWTGLRPGGGNVLHRSGSCTAVARPASTRPRSWSRANGTCAGAAHAPMEPHAALAEWSDGRLTVWTGTQTPFNVRARARGRRSRLDEARRARGLAADGRQLRRQDVHADRGDRGRARPQGRPAGAIRAAPATRSS